MVGNVRVRTVHFSVLGFTSMSFTISAIVLYSHVGEKRVLKFRQHGLNVITGNSKTGKSAIIDISGLLFRPW